MSSKEFEIVNKCIRLAWERDEERLLKALDELHELIRKSKDETR